MYNVYTVGRIVLNGSLKAKLHPIVLFILTSRQLPHRQLLRQSHSLSLLPVHRDAGVVVTVELF